MSERIGCCEDGSISGWRRTASTCNPARWRSPRRLIGSDWHECTAQRGARRSSNSVSRKSQQQRHFLNVSRPAASLASAQPCSSVLLPRPRAHSAKFLQRLQVSEQPHEPAAHSRILQPARQQPTAADPAQHIHRIDAALHHACHTRTGQQEEDAQAHARPRPGPRRPARREAPRRVQGCEAHRRPARPGAELLPRVRKVL
jgi:hypothetical protein